MTDLEWIRSGRGLPPLTNEKEAVCKNKSSSKRLFLDKKKNDSHKPKAIDILFDEIDKFHKEIKASENIRDKVNLLIQMREIIDIISQISCYKIENNKKYYL